MIIGENRKAVIENIKSCAERGDFFSKVETGDPMLSPEEEKRITDEFVKNRSLISYKVKSFFANRLADIMMRVINKDTEIVGLEKIPSDLEGVIVTSNHFSPLENTVIRLLIKKLGRKKLCIISQVTNFAMGGLVGFFMNYANTVPLSSRPHYLARDFMCILKEKLTIKNEAVLLYPEQEMWFNYRKPRPVQIGAYFYSAKLGVPIVSCFVEMQDCDEDENDEFKKVKYVLHVLGVLYPDKSKNVKENTEYLACADYELKKNSYEKAYGKPLDYTFDKADIAGWKA